MENTENIVSTEKVALTHSTIDLVLGLLNRKIEKVEAKEIDEQQVQYLKELKAAREEITSQIS